MLDKNDINTIKQSVLFKKVPDNILQVLLADSSLTEFKRRQTLFIQGDAANNMFVVLEGWVKLTRITPALM